MRILSWPVLVCCSLVGSCGPPGRVTRISPPPEPSSSAPNTIVPEAPWIQESTMPVTVSSDDPILGPRDAPVTIIEFSDFQGPYDLKVTRTMRALVEKYGEKIRIVWKDLPLDFHDNARPAAIVARAVFQAAGSSAFWRAHRMLFDRQGELGEELYRRVVEQLGLGAAEIERQRTRAEAKIDASAASAKAAGVQGVPNFLIDGEPLTGAQPLEKFQSIVDAHLERAALLAQKGTPPREIFAELVKTYWHSPPPEKNDDEPGDTTVWKAEVGTSPVLGKDDALVTVVVFGDFEGPFDKALRPTLEKIGVAYGDKVRFVWKHNPLEFVHKRARAAATLAIEAWKQKGTATFWKAHDSLFAAQPAFDDASLESIAKALGLDAAKAMKCVKTNCHDASIDADVILGEGLGVHGAPVSFVNGRVVTGAEPFDRWRKIVDAELKKAEAKVKAGTLATQVYAETIKGGQGGPRPPLTVPSDAPWKGGKDAKVVIHVFGDFQDPFSKRVFFVSPALDGTIDPEAAGLVASAKKYGDKIKIVFRHNPLPSNARAEPAAELAIEAQQQKGNAGFWKAHDALFASQPKLEEEDLLDVAKRVGLDWGKVKAAIEGKAHKAVIIRDSKDAASVGVTSTPSFSINGRLLVGMMPASAFYDRIDKALAKFK